jgi:hypothetical protein
MKRYRIFLLSASLLLGGISAMAKKAAEWYRLIPGDTVAVEASSPVTRMYGFAHRERLEKMGVEVTETIEESPRFPLRMLNHWDNLDGTIERGYAGRSLWRWDELPDSVSPRYREYAKMCAAVGINGTVLNNVNASSEILSHGYLVKVARIADELRPYGIRVYLSANFAAPMQLDGLPTADPLDKGVRRWWHDKADEIYSLIPDFGGFLVKANSEGQPGPCDFGRSHAQGANMMAKALKKHGGTVIWRAFVYSPADADRAKQAYIEFQPLDGKFESNVIVQIKNGPIDFQPREPISPLLLAMPKTKTMPELQITQEYLGHSNHLAFLAPMWEEFFGHIDPVTQTAIAGVANIGDAPNFTAHPFARANWYAFGRLAWNPALTSEEIAREWVASDLGVTDPDATDKIVGMMLGSREAVVDYMMPMGLHHIFAFGHHYGPEPWCDVPGARPDWLPRYYHRADSTGIGFDRSSSGSDAVSQYPDSLARLYDNPETCPENLLLWFHHLPWDYRLPSGSTLWDSLCRHYEAGYRYTLDMLRTWKKVEHAISDKALYSDVERRLMTQARDAQWWKDACLGYFATFHNLPLPDDVTPSVHNLDELKRIHLGIDNYTCPSPLLLDSLR